MLRRTFEKRTVVTPDKSIAIAAPKLPIHKLLCLLQGDVHVAINRLQLTYMKISKAAMMKGESPVPL